jgi:hypothetical protein
MSDRVLRVPIVRRDADGTCVDGTAELGVDSDGLWLGDFRDLDGELLPLPAGSSYDAAVDIEALDDLDREGPHG